MPLKAILKAPRELPATIWGVGLVTLCLNLSSIIVISLSPLYLTQVFGLSCLGLGLIEGAMEFIALTTRIFAGFLCDALAKRKPLLMMAVGLVTLARPIFPLAGDVTWIFFSRSLERIGNGLQATPREALIGDFAPQHLKGSAYGLRETLGKLGSFLGAILAMIWLTDRVDSYTPIFWFTAIPPVLALLVVMFFVQDKQSQVTRSFKEGLFSVFSKSNFQSLSGQYWCVIIISFLFMLSNYSGAFMILQGKRVTGLDTIAPLTMIVQNSMAMLVAYPLGRLFDRHSHRLILGAGFATVILSNLFLAHATSMTHILLGAGLWGVQMAMTQSILVALVALNCQRQNRGTAFAIYYFFIGTAFFASNYIIGLLNDNFSALHGFYYSIVVAGVAFFFLPLLKGKQELKI